MKSRLFGCCCTFKRLVESVGDADRSQASPPWMLTCWLRVGGLSHLFVRVELGLGRHHRGKLLGRLLLRDGDAGVAQRGRGLHPGCHLSALVAALVPHGSGKTNTQTNIVVSPPVH